MNISEALERAFKCLLQTSKVESKDSEEFIICRPLFHHCHFLKDLKLQSKSQVDILNLIEAVEVGSGTNLKNGHYVLIKGTLTKRIKVSFLKRVSPSCV